jgi:hypothetical protein
MALLDRLLEVDRLLALHDAVDVPITDLRVEPRLAVECSVMWWIVVA